MNLVLHFSTLESGILYEALYRMTLKGRFESDSEREQLETLESIFLEEKEEFVVSDTDLPAILTSIKHVWLDGILELDEEPVARYLQHKIEYMIYRHRG